MFREEPTYQDNCPKPIQKLCELCEVTAQTRTQMLSSHRVAPHTPTTQPSQENETQ